MKKTKRFTKSQAEEFVNMRKRMRISKKEYFNLVTDIKRANAKGKRLEREGEALYIPRFSTNVGNIETRNDYLKRRRALDKVLMRSYKRDINKEQRDKLYENLNNVFGFPADEIISRFKSLTDRELVKFFEENSDLNFVLYYPDEGILDFINETTETINERLKDYEKS